MYESYDRWVGLALIDGGGGSDDAQNTTFIKLWAQDVFSLSILINSWMIITDFEPHQRPKRVMTTCDPLPSVSDDGIHPSFFGDIFGDIFLATPGILISLLERAGASLVLGTGEVVEQSWETTLA